MISEIEKTIGNCERVFDIARNKLEKIVIAIDEAELRGGPPEKLIYDSKAAMAEFAVAVENLNEAYARRDSKAPLTVPPVENYVDLFKKSAVTKRAARDAARREEAAAAGEVAAWLHTIDPEAIPYSQKVASSIVAGLQRLSEKRPESEPPEPTTPSEKVSAIERQINLAKVEVAYLDEQLRPVRRARAASRSGELRAAKSVEVQIAEEELASKKEKLSQLIAQHEALLAEVRQIPIAQSSATR
jgi:hypothetical protein